MLSQQPLLDLPPKARRAANRNYQRLSKTLYKGLANLSLEYDTQVYFLAYRHERFNGFVSIDESSKPWSPPGQEFLVRYSTL